MNSTTKYGSRSKAVSVHEQFSALFCVGGEWSHNKIKRAQVAIILTTRSLPSIPIAKFDCCQVCLFKQNFTTNFVHQFYSALNIFHWMFIDARKNLLFQNWYVNSKIKFALFFTLRRRLCRRQKKLYSRRLIHDDFCGEMSFCVSVNRVFVFAAIAVSEKGNRQPMSINNFIKNRFDAVARTNMGNELHRFEMKSSTTQN